MAEIRRFKNPRGYMKWGDHRVTGTDGIPESFLVKDWDLEMVFTKKVKLPKVGELIPSAVELDKLPGQSAVVDSERVIWQKGLYGDQWFSPSDIAGAVALVAEYAPLTVVYIPAEEG